MEEESERVVRKREREGVEKGKGKEIRGERGERERGGEI